MRQKGTEHDKSPLYITPIIAIIPFRQAESRYRPTYSQQPNTSQNILSLLQKWLAPESVYSNVFVFPCSKLFCVCVWERESMCSVWVCGEYLSTGRVAQGHSDWSQINELETPTSLLLQRVCPHSTHTHNGTQAHTGTHCRLNTDPVITWIAPSLIPSL